MHLSRGRRRKRRIETLAVDDRETFGLRGAGHGNGSTGKRTCGQQASETRLWLRLYRMANFIERKTMHLSRGRRRKRRIETLAVDDRETFGLRGAGHGNGSTGKRTCGQQASECATLGKMLLLFLKGINSLPFSKLLSIIDLAGFVPLIGVGDRA